MCDYCSCRSQPLIGSLSEDHIALMAQSALVERALTAGDLPSARRVLAELCEDLAVHLELEEVALFPALASDAVFATTLERLGGDHAAARAGVRGAGSSPEQWAAGVRVFLAELADHIFLEEHDVFPASVQVLTSGAWQHAEEAAHGFAHEYGIDHSHDHPRRHGH